MDALVDAIYNKLQESLGDYRSEKKELAEVEKKILNITNCITSGIMYPELRQEMDALQERKRSLTKILCNARGMDINREQLKKLVSEKISSCENMKSLIRLFVMKIKVHPDKQITVYLGVATFGSSERGI